MVATSGLISNNNNNNFPLPNLFGDSKSANFVDPSTGAIYIGGVFDRTIITDVIPEIDKILAGSANLAPNLKRLTFNINSVGGEVPQLSALLTTIDFARQNGFQIATYVLGQACSCASMLAMYGDKGLRFIGRTSSHLVHHFSHGCVISTREEIERTYANHKGMDEIIKQLYLSNTKLSSKQYDEFVSCDWKTLYAKDCVKYGLADHII